MKKEKRLFRYINEKELNSYEKENKKLSYYNLFYKDENRLLCNEIVKDAEDLELVYGYDYDEGNDCYDEIYQYYLIDESTAKRLGEYGELIYYDNRLDLYVLGVTHYGTSWDYVLTSIKIKPLKDNKTMYECYYEVESYE